MNKKFVATVAAGAFALALAGCSTTTVYETSGARHDAVEMMAQGGAEQHGPGQSGPGGQGGPPPNQPEMKEAMDSYLQCLTDQGLELAELTPPDAPAGEQGTRDGSAPRPHHGPAGAQGQPGQEGPEGHLDRLAERLGQDTSDPEWIAANDECETILTDAFEAAHPTVDPAEK